MRRTVLDTLATGNPHQLVEASLPFAVDGHRRQFSFLLSTSLLKSGEPLVLVSLLDITERKRAELEREAALAALRESEERVRRKLSSILSPDEDLGNLDLKDIIDPAAIQSLMDDFHTLTGLPVGIIDLRGEVLVGTGWQDICTKFHRANGSPCQVCIDSDTVGTLGLAPGEYRSYVCPHHLCDVVTPIVVGGRHVGNLFTGQFFYADMAVDRELFREQARRYGFDEQAYLAALDRVPRFTRERIDQAMSFYIKLAGLVARLSHSNLQLARSGAALRDSEESARALLNAHTELAYMMAPDGRGLAINDETARSLGVPKEQLQGGCIYDFIPAEVARRRRARVDEVVRAGRPVRFEDEYSGAILDTSIHPIFDAEGQVTRLAIFGRDITELKRTERQREKLLQRVRTQSEQLAQVMRSVPEGVILLDAQARVVLANPRGQKDLAKVAGVAVGDRLTRLGERAVAELLISPPAGHWHDVSYRDQVFEVISRPVESGPTGSGWVLVLREVTQERLAQRQHEQQERLAAVGQLAAGVAHDFNNILGVITLYAGLSLNDPSLSPALRRRMATIDQQARLASDLIQQILDFGRRSVLDRLPVDLVSFLKEAVKLLRRTLPESIDVLLSYDHGSYVINADPTRIQQALLNLATNARDAMPEGGKLRFRLEQAPNSATGEPWIRLTVGDTRTGIQPDVLPHILGPFFTTKERGHGSGLGLAQVYGIVKQHEGEVEVSSALGHGTTFVITLPAMPAPVTPTLEIPVAELPHGNQETLLLVEDNAVVRQALVDTLELLNYRILTAANGQEALAIHDLHHDKIRLVVSDLVMPVMGGRALFRALRARRPDVRVMLLSGHPLEGDIDDLQAEGLAGWLMKPVDAPALANAIAKALG